MIVPPSLEGHSDRVFRPSPSRPHFPLVEIRVLADLPPVLASLLHYRIRAFFCPQKNFLIVMK